MTILNRGLRSRTRTLITEFALPTKRKSSSLTRPLWVIGIALLLLALATGFIGWQLWRRNAATGGAASRADTNSEDSPVTRRVASPSPLARAADQRRNRDTSGEAGSASEHGKDARPEVRLAATIQRNGTVPDAAASGMIGAVVSRGHKISGRVILRGTPPPEKPLALDASCSALASQPKTTRFYLVGTNGGLADVFVYIRSGLSNVSVLPVQKEAPVVIDQRGCEYQPYVIGLRTGDTLKVRNSDNVIHNVHFVPEAAGNPEANKAQPAGTPDLSFVWTQPEIFLRLKCDVHPWMFAYIGIVDHPFFAVTDGNGRFHIPVPPPGHYVIEAVHRKTHGEGGKGVTREIDILPGKDASVEFEVVLPELTADAR